MEIEIAATSFSWHLKQQVNFKLFWLDWYWEKRGFTELPGHEGKLTSDINLFDGNLKKYRLEIEILAAVFNSVPKQQLTYHSFCKIDIPESLGWRITWYDWKVALDINFILSPNYRSYSADRGFYMNRC